MDFYTLDICIYIYIYLLYVVEESNLYISPDIQIPPQKEVLGAFLQYVPEPSPRLGPETLDLLVRSPRDVQTWSAFWWRPKLVARLERRVIGSNRTVWALTMVINGLK